MLLRTLDSRGVFFFLSTKRNVCVTKLLGQSANKIHYVRAPLQYSQPFEKGVRVGAFIHVQYLHCRLHISQSDKFASNIILIFRQEQ